MKRTKINQITKELHDKEILLKGWAQDIRNLAKIKFILIRDDTGVVQLVALKDKTDEKTIKIIEELTPETVIEVQGIVNAKAQAKSGVEVLVKSLKVLAKSEPLPIQVYEKDKSIKTDLSKRLDFRCLDLRKPEHNAVFNIQSALIQGIRDELFKKDFIQVFTPCIMGVPSESGSEVFKLDYFGKTAFLRQDPQLHRQLTIAGGVDRLVDIGPGWRAEKSHTTEHLCEHRVVAAEMAFLKDEKDTMKLQEEVIIAALKNVKEKCKNELELLRVKINVPKPRFPELRFPEIYHILEKMGKKLEFGEDLDSEANDLIWEHVKKKYDCEFYFFNRFPSKLKPFYVMKVDEDPEHARSVDLNFRGIELSSGGQRENRYDKLMEQVKEKGMDPKEVEWFTKFFKYGVPPHGGFALGIERLTMSLLNIKNIRDCVLFPRDTERNEP